MRRLHRLAVWILLTIGLCGCTFSKEKKEDEHLALQEHATRKGEQQATETVRTGPETITTTTEEYEDTNEPPQVPAAPPDGGLPLWCCSSTVDQMRALRPIGRVLVKRTVTVDQRGPVVAIKASSATESGCEDVGLDLTKHTEDDSNTSPALAGYLWMALAVAAVVGAGWLAWKFSLPGKIMAVIRAL